MTPYLTIARIDGEPGELARIYAESADTMAAVGRDHGLQVHATGTSSDGLVMVNLWPSVKGSEDAAADPRRLGVLAGLKLDPSAIRREHFDVVDLQVAP